MSPNDFLGDEHAWDEKRDEAQEAAQEEVTLVRLVFGVSGNTTLDTISVQLYDKLYRKFFHDMPITTANGDEGTFDEWFYDNIEMVQTEFADIEHLNDDKGADDA